MNRLKLRFTDEPRNPDALPFPGVGPARPWRPKAELPPARHQSVREVEQALEAVSRRFENLKLLVDEDAGPERPWAA